MKLLWIVNMVLPPLAEELGVSRSLSGTWLFDLTDKLDADPDVELAIACVYGQSFRRVTCGNTTYYCLPGTGRDMMFGSRSFAAYWKQIVEEFKPDIVNIHGTEYRHALPYVRLYADKIPTVVSLQGILEGIKTRDLAGLSRSTILRHKTLREWVRMNGVWEYHRWHEHNAKSEGEILRSVPYCMAVDTWHAAMALRINPHITTFRVNYNLRDEFYSAPKWSLAGMERHVITTNPGGTALKGLHILLRAVAMLKDRYPDIQVRVPGMSRDGKTLAITSGYAKYLARLIRSLGLEGHVVFLGARTGEEMIENMSHAHVQVVPSAIEGPSLILREGMHLGVPTIASFRGGMADFVSDKQDGFLFDFDEYQYLAHRIMEIFEDDALALRLSQNAIAKAEAAHDRDRNYQDYIRMLTTILQAPRT